MHSPPRALGIVAPPAIRTAVRELLEHDGDLATAARLKISRTSLARLAGALRVRRGTIALAAQQLGIDVDLGEGIGDAH
jgi:hypothetical protein